MARVFFTDAEALSRSGDYGDPDACQKLQQTLGLSQGMPFLLDEEGAPLRAANRWLAALPVYGCASPRTWKAYAFDFLDWEGFLGERGATALAATRDDLAAYHAARRLGEGGEVLSPSSWNRRMSALDSFYGWALEEGLLDAVPFTYRSTRFTAPDGVSGVARRNMAKERTARPSATLKWLEQDHLRFFLDVGMSGLQPDGSEDPAFQGRQAARNRAFAELLATTGLRAQEASFLTAVELPQVPLEPRVYVAMDLPARICKGGKPRTILIPPATLRTLHGYARLERAEDLASAEWRPTRPLLATKLDVDGLAVDSKKRKWSALSVEDRRRLVFPEGGSPLLFLKSTGDPLKSWDAVFAAATARCRGFDPSFPHATPHTLRHTYAVHMLRWLIEQVATRVKQKVDSSGHDTWAPYWRSHDPLLTLRDLLGHSSVATTQVYLEAIDATRLYAEVMEELDDE